MSDLYNTAQTPPKAPVILGANGQPAAYGSFSGSEPSRLRHKFAYQRSFSGTEEKALTNHDRTRLTLEGMDLLRNNEVVPAAMERFASYSVHHGIFPTAASSDPHWNRLATDWFKEVYMPQCDYRGISDLVEMQRLSIKARPIAGECFFVKVSDGSIHET